jgi:RNA polymerase sigma factor (sigma-70 family)
MKSKEEYVKSLVIKCLAGEQEAFRNIFDCYFQELYRTAFVLMKSPIDADDVVQEAFIRVFNSLDKYDLNRPFRPWIQRILLNACKDFWKRKRWNLVPIEQLYDLIDNGAVCPEYECLKDEELKKLAAAMQKLSPKHRMVVVLHFLNGMRINEVAEVVDAPSGTVKSRLHHALKALRRHLTAMDSSYLEFWLGREEELTV